MSSSLIKLIDASILPAALLIVGKVFGWYITIKFFALQWQVNFVNNELISVYPVVFEKDLMIASSYSDLIMLLIILAGYLFITIRAVYFHNTHIDPRLVTRLANVNLLGLVKDSFKIYYRAAMWLVFTLVGLLIVSFNAITGKTFFWVPLVGIVLFVGISVFLLKDVEEEIERERKNLAF